MEVEVVGNVYTTRLRDAEVPNAAFQQLTLFNKPIGRAASNLKCNTSPHVRCCNGRTTKNVQATDA
jgi:hypothetical protein